VTAFVSLTLVSRMHGKPKRIIIELPDAPDNAAGLRRVATAIEVGEAFRCVSHWTVPDQAGRLPRSGDCIVNAAHIVTARPVGAHELVTLGVAARADGKDSS
jgi:hypothetical protein